MMIFWRQNIWEKKNSRYRPESKSSFDHPTFCRTDNKQLIGMSDGQSRPMPPSTLPNSSPQNVHTSHLFTKNVLDKVGDGQTYFDSSEAHGNERFVELTSGQFGSVKTQTSRLEYNSPTSSIRGSPAARNPHEAEAESNTFLGRLGLPADYPNLNFSAAARDGDQFTTGKFSSSSSLPSDRDDDEDFVPPKDWFRTEETPSTSMDYNLDDDNDDVMRLTVDKQGTVSKPPANLSQEADTGTRRSSRKRTAPKKLHTSIKRPKVAGITFFSNDTSDNDRQPSRANGVDKGTYLRDQSTLFATRCRSKTNEPPEIMLPSFPPTLSSSDVEACSSTCATVAGPSTGRSIAGLGASWQPEDEAPVLTLNKGDLNKCQGQRKPQPLEPDFMPYYCLLLRNRLQISQICTGC